MINFLPIGILFLSFTTFANSVPKKYSNCEIKNKINAPSGYSDYYINQDCNQVYVLPPIEGKVDISSAQTTMDQSLCSSTMSLINQLQDQMEDIKIERKKIQSEYDAAMNTDRKILQLNQECTDYGLNIVNYDKQIEILNAEMEYERAAYKNEKEKQNNCYEDNGKNYFGCKLYKRSIDKHKKTLDRGKEIINLATLKRKILAIERDSCHAKVDFLLNSNLSESTKYTQQRDKLLNKLGKFQIMLNEMLSQESEVSGAEFGINILSNHQAIVTEFSNLNKHLDVQFKKMPIKEAYINFELIENGAVSGYPVIQKSNITGFNVEKESQGIVSLAIKPRTETNIKALFGEGVGGKVVINRLATCKILQQTNNDINPINVAELIRPTVNYEYELQVDRRIKVKFNESHFYQLVKKATKTKSGLFKTKTLNSLTETSNASKWLSIDFYSEDGDHAFVNSLEMALDIRREFAQAAISKVAKSYLNNSQVNLLDGGQTAAEGASSILKKDCKQKFCQKAAIVLDLGNALFGGSSQEANVTKKVNSIQRTKINDIRMVPASGQQVFKP